MDNIDRESIGLGVRSKKLTPFKVLVAILYSQADYMEWLTFPNGDRQLLCKLGPLSRSMGLPNYRLRDHLHWLDHNAFISDLKLSYGEAVLIIPTPTAWRDDYNLGELDS